MTSGRSWERALRLGDPTGRRGAGSRGVEAIGFFLEDLPGAVGGAVVNDDDFMRDAAEFQLEVKVLDGGCDAPFLVAGGNDDGEVRYW